MSTVLRALLGPVAMLLVLAGCSSEPGTPLICVDTLCQDGESVCLGNDVAQCIDGLSWQISPCGSAMHCDKGSCKARVCTQLGGGSCVDAQTLTTCAVDGMGLHTADCAGTEVCAGGMCVLAACAEGQTRCGYRAVLSCTGDAWAVEECPTDHVCTDVGGVSQCQAQACVAEEALCDGEASVVCSSDGATATTTPCGAGQICKHGHCQAVVCGVDDVPGGPDGVALDANDDGGVVEPEDTGPEVIPPPLETVSRIAFTLQGVDHVFDLNARADYISSSSMLKISGAKSVKKIELNYAPIAPFTVGSWTDTDVDSEMVLTVCFYDGTDNIESPGCTVGFTYSSIAYDTTLDENNGVGSRIVGAFEATLEDNLGNMLDITDGTFDVLHK